ncbi:MAG: pre-16S rRNA-processing nuclease YqgF [Candidatus Eremiobacteraeota bacterium]|nr:pre-16S rRNA-processing nuclease YqgF [Candidatus Eremiobacteraeota bacterium]
MTSSVLGIDPGTRKAGFAILSESRSAALERGIEPIANLLDRVRPLLGRYGVRAIALGRGTHASAISALLTPLGLPVILIDETGTTLEARAEYFRDHPPRGWRRLIPLGLQVPPRPIDDYAASLIARRYLERQG